MNIFFFSLRVVDISDEVTDVEMSNNESEEKGAIVSEVNVAAFTKKQPNNREISRVRQSNISFVGMIFENYIEYMNFVKRNIAP